MLPLLYRDNKLNYITVQMPPIVSFCIQNLYNRTTKFNSARITGHELKLASFMFYYPFKTGLPSPFWMCVLKNGAPNVFISRPNLHLL